VASEDRECAFRSPRDGGTIEDRPSNAPCEFAGHEWRDAGGGLEICVLCEAERWAAEARDG